MSRQARDTQGFQARESHFTLRPVVFCVFMGHIVHVIVLLGGSTGFVPLWTVWSLGALAPGISQMALILGTLVASAFLVPADHAAPFPGRFQLPGEG